MRAPALALVFAAVATFLPGAAHARRPMTLKMPTYEVPPRSDREVCTFVPVPGGAAIDLAGWAVSNNQQANSTSHHFILYAYTGTDADKLKQYIGKATDDEACINMVPDPSELRFLGGAQTPRYRQIMGRGLALQVDAPSQLDGKTITGFVLNSHWINGSDLTRKAKAQIKLIPAKPKAVKKRLKPIFEVFANAGLKVAPGSVRKTGGSWGPGLQSFGARFGGIANPEGPACVTMLTGHMHRRGMLFEAIYHNGTDPDRVVYSTEKYNDPGQANFSPPLLVQQGERIRYECTQDNQADPRMGCEEDLGITPGQSIIEWVSEHGFDGEFAHPARLCSTDADCAGFGTGRCVPANLVFGFHSFDDMCILPGYYYDADSATGCFVSR